MMFPQSIKEGYTGRCNQNVNLSLKVEECKPLHTGTCCGALSPPPRACRRLSRLRAASTEVPLPPTQPRTATSAAAAAAAAVITQRTRNTNVGPRARFGY